MAVRAMTVVLRKKVLTTIERTEHLVTLTPVGELDWRPTTVPGAGEACELGHLLGHLLDCMAGFCAAFHAAFPKRLARLAKLKSEKVNHFCAPEEWRARVGIYRKAIGQGFRACTDQDLGRPIKTVFNPRGELFGSILLGNLEHVLNHKYQLFFYLKLLGVPVGTGDLYDLGKRPAGRAGKRSG